MPLEQGKMYHFDTHEINVKLDENNLVADVDLDGEKGYLTSMYISQAIKTALESNESGIIERINSIYGDRINSLIELDELKNEAA